MIGWAATTLCGRQCGRQGQREAGAGTDLVNSSVTFTLGANVENLTLTGVGNISGTGNTLNNIIIGNTGANAINGGSATTLFMALPETIR